MTGRRNMLPVLIAAAAAATASVDAADSVTSVDAISSVAAPLADLHASGSPRHLAGCDFDQLLNNGDFENGDITPWYKDGKWGGHSVQLVEGGYNSESCLFRTGEVHAANCSKFYLLSRIIRSTFVLFGF